VTTKKTKKRKKKASDHLVVLFGAGATRGAFDQQVLIPPTEYDFFDIAGQLGGRGTQRLTQQVTSEVFSLYRRVSAIGLEQYFRDIETRAEIGKFAKSQNKPKDWEKRKAALVELIRRVLIYTTCDLASAPAKARISALHSKILGHVRSGDTLVTFNYDTVIEEAIAGAAFDWDPKDGYGVTCSGVTNNWTTKWRNRKKTPKKPPKSQVHLLKLHGSLNWTLYKDKTIRLKDRPYVVRANRGDPTYEDCSILPPGWKKPIDKNPYKQLWAEARLKVESCSALAIIGYSLPETDLLARAFFAEASRKRSQNRKPLRHLYLADRSDAVKNRLAELFAPALGPKGQVHRYAGIAELAGAWKKQAPKR
jgi:hypothetical protein